MGESLKECLDERVRYNTIYPDCMMYRLVFYVWDTTDKITDTFCKKLKTREMEASCPIPAKNSEEAAEMFKEEWEKCLDRIDAGELIYPKERYILVIGRTPQIAERLGFPSCHIEFARLMEDLNWEMPAIEQHFNCCTEWRIRERDIDAALALLMHAAYSRDLIKPLTYDNNQYNVFGLKCKEYNAVREKMCNYYLTILSQQLKESEYDMNMINEYLDIERKSKWLVGLCVKPEWIPFIGYEKLKKKLYDQFQISLDRKIMMIIHELNPIQTKLTLEEVLTVLQGDESGIPRTEWLRRITRKVDLPVFCKKMIDEKKEEIKNIIQKKFSLYDIRFSLSNYLEGYCENILEQRAEQIEENIAKLLKNPFASKSIEINDVLDGVKSYYQLWQQYIKVCAEITYLKYIENVIDEMRIDISRNYQEIKSAENIFNNLRGNICSSKQITEKEIPVRGTIQDGAALMKAMKEFVSHIQFCRADVRMLKAAIDKEYQNTKENHVDQYRHPQIYFIFNEGLSDKENEERYYFHWVEQPVSYIPKSVFRELRIYNMNQ